MDTDYLPYFKDNDDNTWNILSMNWCIDWGGRQCQIECQRNNGDGIYPIKSFVIYGLTGEFRQWDEEEVISCTPIKDGFYKHVMDMFKYFDCTNQVIDT